MSKYLTVRWASTVTYATYVKQTHKQKRGLMALVDSTLSSICQQQAQYDVEIRKTNVMLAAAVVVYHHGRQQSSLTLDRSDNSDIMHPPRGHQLQRIKTILVRVQKRTRRLRSLNTIKGKAEGNTDL